MKIMVEVEVAAHQLDSLIDAATTGTEVLIARNGVAVAKLVTISEPAPRKLGLLKGTISTTDDFDDPLPDEMINSFYEN